MKQALSKHYRSRFKSSNLRIVLLFLVFILNPMQLIAEYSNPDSVYFKFGQIFKAEHPKHFTALNPHHVAQYSIFLCKEGLTYRLLKEIGHVEESKELGQSFSTFIREFGPDLEQYKDKSIYLKLGGYKDGKDTSAWYYYLVDADGKNLVREPWVSIHRSKYNGKCALTGIFLNLSRDGYHPMPGDLLLATKEYQERADNKKISKYYKLVINTLGELYGAFQLMSEKAGGYGWWAGTKSKIQSMLKSNEHSKQFEKNLDKATRLMTSITWPLSYNAGGSIRRKQVKIFRKIMPCRFSTHEDFLTRISEAIQIAFPHQTQEFHQKMFDEILVAGNNHKEEYTKLAK